MAQQIGIHPLLTLFSMYLGLQLFGILGMIIGPVLMVIIKSILSAVVKTDGFKTWLQRNFGSGLKVSTVKKEPAVKKD